jgi:hypothetical protein
MSREVLGSAVADPNDGAPPGGGVPRPTTVVSVEADGARVEDPTTARRLAEEPTPDAAPTDGDPHQTPWKRVRLTGLASAIALVAGLAGAALATWDAHRVAEAHPRATVMLWETGQPWSPDLSSLPLSLTVVNTGGAPFTVEAGHVSAPTADAQISVTEPGEPIEPGETTVLSVHLDAQCAATGPAADDPSAGDDEATETIELTVRTADGRTRTLTAAEMPGVTSGQLLGYLCTPPFDPFTAEQLSLAPDGRLAITVKVADKDGRTITVTGPDGTQVTLDPPQPVIEDGSARMRIDLVVTGCPASLLDRDSVGEVVLHADDLQMSPVNYDPVLVTSWVTRKVVSECG